MTEGQGERPVLEIVASGATDIGRRREHNEDTILLRPDLNLYLVADGAGGHNAGNVASALAATSIGSFYEATEDEKAGPSVDRFGIQTGARRIARAIQKANRDVVEISKSSQKHRGMGSTVVAIAASPNEPLIHVAHVGDSRCYRLRNGHLEHLTHDHSLLNDVIELQPDIPDEALTKLPRKVVTRALGMEDTVRSSVRTFEVLSGDRYLLCSDGLTGEVEDDDIRRALSLDVDPSEIAERLVELANDAGGSDNVAAVVLVCDVIPPSTPRRRAQLIPARDAEEELLGLEPDDAFDALRPYMHRKGPVTCSQCGVTFDGTLLYCPQCGLPKSV